MFLGRSAMLLMGFKSALGLQHSNSRMLNDGIIVAAVKKSKFISVSQTPSPYHALYRRPPDLNRGALCG
jgi:hypothetical protein